MEKSNISRAPVDSSSQRLVSLRHKNKTTVYPPTNNRRPDGEVKRRFVPKAAVRRSSPVSSGEKSFKPSAMNRITKNKELDDRKGNFRKDSQTHGGRGRGRYPVIPVSSSRKVAFVGAKAAGSSLGGRPTPDMAAGGSGISLKDQESLDNTSSNLDVFPIPETSWPPEIESPMQPMSLPVGKAPESIGADGSSILLFVDKFGTMSTKDDSLFFIQLPTRLPLEKRGLENKSINDGQDSNSTSKDSINVKSDNASTGRADNGTFDDLKSVCPTGCLGKIQILKSGKTVLRMGSNKFEVAAGLTPTFVQELASIDSEIQQLNVLGTISQHLVITPDFEHLLGATT